MGWFNAVMAVWGDNPTFSSPSGDGLVLFCGVLFFSFFRRFSSPSGDGLVREGKTMKDIAELFSSPSGDGLVQEHGTSYSYGEYFRPHLGLGWFYPEKAIEIVQR